MANYITIGNHFINLDKANDIEVWKSENNITIVKVDYGRYECEIPCAGDEQSVRDDLIYAITTGPNNSLRRGPDSP